MSITYVVPLRTQTPAGLGLFRYLSALPAEVQVIVVDGSPSSVYDLHHVRCGNALLHIPVDDDLTHWRNGKVAGVVTGLRHAGWERVVIADDDVRYDATALETIAHELERYDVVRPQNYFEPMPWHAYVDTARTLLNRMTGGDWPGTLGVRRSILLSGGGYDGDVLFENLELVRTVVARGGVESVPLDLFVRREPPSSPHFWSQRVRQAYDEFARPLRLFLWLLIAPAATLLVVNRQWSWIVVATVACILLAESGRRRRHGTRVFPLLASFAAPAWIVERAVCTWLALGARLWWGGVPYHGRIVARAATSLNVLQRRAKAPSNDLARP